MKLSVLVLVGVVVCGSVPLVAGTCVVIRRCTVVLMRLVDADSSKYGFVLKDRSRV